MRKYNIILAHVNVSGCEKKAVVWYVSFMYNNASRSDKGDSCVSHRGKHSSRSAIDSDGYCTGHYLQPHCLSVDVE